MEEFIVKRVVQENGEEIIELDLNKARRTRNNKYSTYMDEVERLAKNPRKASRQFIQIIQ